ncbi:MAG: hypothetical protein HOP02_15430 [Methylococcaceae bacterium]|nr:hypothetical protein [Methylococcaceae bacterium]
MIFSGSKLSDSRNTLVLLSQACDISAPCSIEPTLEFVIARRPKKNQPPYSLNLDGRSSRFLELELNGNWHKAEASKILHIPKKTLFEEGNKLQPSQLNDRDIEVLARWRANRYMRIALPDTFNDKIKPLVDKGLFDYGLDDAGGLYLQIDPFTESDKYIVRLFALHRQGSSIDSFDALFNKMEAILEAINGIDGLNCPFLDEEKEPTFEEVFPAMRRGEVSIALRDHFVRWNFDYISLKLDDSKGIDED